MRKLSFNIGAIVFLSLLFVPVALRGKNAPLSKWMIDLSEDMNGLGNPDTTPEIAVVGNTVHTIWISKDKANGWLCTLNYRRSVDGGVTWDAKQSIYTRLYMGSDTRFRRMWVSGTTVHIAVDSRTTTNGTDVPALIYIRSKDNGVTFDQPKVIYSQSPNDITAVFVTGDAGKLTIGCHAYCHYCINNAFLLFNSDDGGANFTTRTAFSADKGSGWTVWDLQRSGDNIYLVYTDQYYYYGLNYGDLYFGASRDAGANFTSQRISIPSKNGNHKANGSQDNNYVPKIAADGKSVSVVWNGLDGNDVLSLFYRRSLDNGVTFNPVINLTTGAIPNNEPLWAGQETVGMKGSYVYVLMLVSDGKNYSRIYLRRSIDGGATFKDMQKLTAADGSWAVEGGWWPTIQIDSSDASGAKVHVLWNGPAYCTSGDAGATFGKHVVLDPRFSMGSQARPRLAVGGDGVIHCLTEGQLTAKATNGAGDVDIFYRRLAGPATPSGNTALKLVRVDPNTTSSDDYRYDNMQIAPSSWVNFTSAMTAEAWIKVNRDANSEGYFLFKAETGKGGSWGSYMLGQWRDGKLDARIATTSAGYVAVDGPVIPNNTWTHVAMTYDAGGGADNFRIYVNGQLAGKQTATGNIISGNGILFVDGTSSYSYHQDVTIDELRLWNRAVSQSDLATSMNRHLKGTESGLAAYYPFDNSTKDLTGHGNDGVLMYRESFVDGYTMPVVITKKDFIGSWAGQGTYYRNSDTGAWTSVSSATTQVTAGDLDGDGIDDLVGMWAGSGVWVKYSTNGQWAYLASSSDYIAVGDFNGDGKDDLAGIWGGDIYIRDSATAAWKYFSSGANMVCAGDMDGDGKDDLIGNWPGYGVYVFYSSTGKWDYLCSSPSWLAVGDLNGDGKADLLGIWGSGVWARDTATGAWTNVTSSANQVVAADLDGDGKADLIGNWPGSGVWVKYSSTGSWDRLSASADWIATGRLR